MLSFKQFLTEQLLNEVLDSKFEVLHFTSYKKIFNDKNKDKVCSGHTALMGSEHMTKHNLYVLRAMNKNSEIEYHLMNFDQPTGMLPPEKQSAKALLHSLKIIHDDSQSYLDRGRKIKLQTDSDKQHENYKKLANHIIKNRPNRRVVDIGQTERLDGHGSANTLMIQEEINPEMYSGFFFPVELWKHDRRIVYKNDS